MAESLPPLYQVTDWLARTVLAYTLGVPAAKFNDDRLARTLDAISQHKREIWQDIVHQAFVQAEIDLSLIIGLNMTTGGNLPTEYELWSGRTADLTTVRENMERLCRLVKRHGWPVAEVAIILHASDGAFTSRSQMNSALYSVGKIRNMGLDVTQITQPVKQ